MRQNASRREQSGCWPQLWLHAVLIRVIPDFDQAGDLQSLDGVARRPVLSNGVPLFEIMQRKPKRRGHVLTGTDSPALVVDSGHCGAGTSAHLVEFGDYANVGTR